MAGSLANDAGKRAALNAVAQMRRMLTSAQTDVFLAEVLKSANCVLQDVPNTSSSAANTRPTDRKAQSLISN